MTNSKPTVIISGCVNLNHLLVSFYTFFILFQVYPTLHRALEFNPWILFSDDVVDRLSHG